MNEPTTTPASQTTPAGTARQVTGAHQLDHNQECVGCGAHVSNPCHPTCPFETGSFSPPVLLRAAAGRLRDNPAGLGYDIRGALFAAALDLVGRDAAGSAADEAQEVLTTFLIDEWVGRAELVRAEVVDRHGQLTMDAHVIAPVVARRAPGRRTAVPSTVPTADRGSASQPVHPHTPSSVRVFGFALGARRTGTTSEQPGSLISSDGRRRAGRGPIT